MKTAQKLELYVPHLTPLEYLKKTTRKFKKTSALLKKGTLTIRDVHRIRVATRKLESFLLLFKENNSPLAEKVLNPLKKTRKIFSPLREVSISTHFAKTASEKIHGLKPLEKYFQKKLKKEFKNFKENKKKLSLLFEKILKVEKFKEEDLILDKSEVQQSIMRKQLAHFLEEDKKGYQSEKDPHLHEVRVEIKKLRYLCEILDLFGMEQYSPFIEKMKQQQDILGEIQDRFDWIETLKGLSAKTISKLKLTQNNLSNQITHEENQLKLSYSAWLSQTSQRKMLFEELGGLK